MRYDQFRDIQIGKRDIDYNNQIDWRSYSAIENLALAHTQYKKMLVIPEDYNNTINAVVNDVSTALKKALTTF